ncbi:MAG TPA: sugar phosphate nucleotidyltransferase [Gemmatimonadales bacterium]|nr:sugar phosphate nucleotidyltransferase [Gemmatimonadales bacterium]
MKVIIPLAGKGTRLLPLTRHVPKPLLRVAGRPVMDYVMDKLDGLDVEELIIITGHLKEQVEQYVRTHYPQPARFIEQKVQDGTAGAVALAEPYVRGPVLIIFVDTLFDADLSPVKREEADGIIWAKEVEDYQRFGVVVTDRDGFMTKIVEKPSEPVSRLANIGLYYIRDWRALYQGVHWTLGQPKNKGEWFLTDAFQHMIDHGRKIRVAEVGGWYDCGKVDTLLETNQHLLRNGRSLEPRVPGVTVVPPVRVAPGVTLERCTIGPNVTLDQGAVVRDSAVRDAIVGEGARVEGATVAGCLVGDGAAVRGGTHTGMVIARDEAAPAR